VTVRDLQGVVHATTVTASSVFEAAAAAIGVFKHEGWALEALTASAVIRIEVQLPPVVHEVPMKALERWLNGPSAAPRDVAAKRPLRG
jgi:hypothetical protein